MSDEVQIHIRGITTDHVREVLPQIVTTVRPQLQRVLDVDNEHERLAAVSTLLADAVVEGVRFAWSELAAQLIEAGVKFTGRLVIVPVSTEDEA